MEAAVGDAVILSTDQIDPSLRNDIWREMTGPLFRADLPEEARGGLFEGYIESRFVSKMLVGATTFNPQNYIRDRRLILDTDFDSYFIQLFVKGTLRGNVGENTITVRPGDICIFDLAQTAQTAVSAGATISLLLPRSEIDRAAKGCNIHGFVFPLEAPITKLVTGLIANLSDNVEKLQLHEIAAVESAIATLIGSAFSSQHSADELAEPYASTLLRYRILQFIEANLFEANLSPTLLMERFRVSRTHLYRTFEKDGGVARVIREKRLDCAYRQLAHGGQLRTIKELAYRLGFSSTTQFLNAFRTRFDMAPSEAIRGRMDMPVDMPQMSRLYRHFAKASAHYHSEIS